MTRATRLAIARDPARHRGRRPYLAQAAARGEIRARLDRREAAEWIVRLLLSLAVMPSAVVDFDDPPAVRAYVARYIVRGLAP